MIKLTPKNFFSNYIIHPFSKDLNKKDKAVAFVSSIAFGFLTLGFAHFNAKCCHKPTSSDSQSLTSNQKKAAQAAQNILPNAGAKPKVAVPEGKLTSLEPASKLRLLKFREQVTYALENEEDPDSYAENASFYQEIEKLITSNLRKADGFAIGETHSSRAGLKFLIDQMDSLKEAGVKYLFFELKEDEYAVLLKEFYANDGMSKKLKLRLFAMTALSITSKEFEEEMQGLPPISGKENTALTPLQIAILSELHRYEQKQRYNHYQLFEAARHCGIRIVPIDAKEVRFDHEQATDKQLFYKLRCSAMNEYAEDIIRQTLGDSNEKYVIFCGAAHARKGSEKTDPDEPGLAKRLDIPLVSVYHSLDDGDPHSLVKRDNHSYKRYHKILYTLPRWRSNDTIKA